MKRLLSLSVIILILLILSISAVDETEATILDGFRMCKGGTEQYTTLSKSGPCDEIYTLKGSTWEVTVGNAYSQIIGVGLSEDEISDNT